MTKENLYALVMFIILFLLLGFSNLSQFKDTPTGADSDNTENVLKQSDFE
ncbi:hypothetical protein V6R21_18235 [Limibacter armeniacum]